MNRNELFLKNLVLASVIHEGQDLELKYRQRDLMSAGDKMYLTMEDDEPTILSQVQADEINAESIQDQISVMDTFDSDLPSLKFCDEMIGALATNDRDVFFENIGRQTQDFFAAMEWETVQLVTDEKTPYLIQRNDFLPVREAGKKLISMGLDSEYAEGIELTSETTPEFISAMFWLVRCDPMMPQVKFSGGGSSSVGTFCKYGNFHFDCYSHSEAKKLKKALGSTGFDTMSSQFCCERFSMTGAIEGRSISVN
jgi:hypothetical protein